MLWTQSLLQESEQNRDDNARLQAFPEANEEDFLDVSMEVHKRRVMNSPGTANTFGMATATALNYVGYDQIKEKWVSEEEEI